MARAKKNVGAGVCHLSRLLPLPMAHPKITLQLQTQDYVLCPTFNFFRFKDKRLNNFERHS
jgi:hypothetical protein